ncbi:MAG: AraC family transcriptional regulator, partial [Pseudomonadota bacterium]
VANVTSLIQHELDTMGAASLIILNRLTEVLFFCALRDWAGRSFVEGGALAALSDQRLHRALSAIHDSPDRNWTIESLAQVAGQSRTAFASGFRQAMATTPMGYVTRYRTLLARRMLTETSLALDDIASRTGYSDTNAFSRAFRRAIGTSPGAFRKSSRT